MGAAMETDHETRVAYVATVGAWPQQASYGWPSWLWPVADLWMTSTWFPTETGHEGQFYERDRWQTGRVQTSARETKRASEGRLYELGGMHGRHDLVFGKRALFDGNQVLVMGLVTFDDLDFGVGEDGFGGMTEFGSGGFRGVFA